VVTAFLDNEPTHSVQTQKRLEAQSGLAIYNLRNVQYQGQLFECGQQSWTSQRTQEGPINHLNTTSLTRLETEPFCSADSFPEALDLSLIEILALYAIH
jgi:hypothetical protein